MTVDADFVVVGAGMAGATVAAVLAEHARVLLLEAEERPGYHTTGRSAATFIENYGPAPVRALTRASRAFFEAPPAGFSDTPLLSRRGVLMVAAEAELPALEAELHAGLGLQRLDARACAELVPVLAGGPVVAGAYEADARDIDVDALHQGALRRLRRRAGVLQCKAQLRAAARHAGVWRLDTTAGTFAAPQVVNASGAWGDQVGALFGAQALGLQPLRRSIGVFEIGGPAVVAPDWPLLAGAGGDWYCKPQGEWLMVSPADETPSEPCDAYAEDIDVATGAERLQHATGLTVRRLQRSWAGLRTFAPDRVPVAGADPRVPGLFWLVGQGGYGIQTAPALAAVAAGLLLGQPPEPAWASLPLDIGALDPARFMSI